MLHIVIPAADYFNEATGEFIEVKEQPLQLEHSLVSLSRWESKWQKPFLGDAEKTEEQCRDYIRCMTLTQHVNPAVYQNVTPAIFAEVNKYIELPMTATWFKERRGGPRNREVVTAEIIYYWMISLNIPFECQKWHLNKLLALIRVCNIKNTPDKKMGRKETLSRNRALNAARRSRAGTRG